MFLPRRQSSCCCHSTHSSAPVDRCPPLAYRDLLFRSYHLHIHHSPHRYRTVANPTYVVSMVCFCCYNNVACNLTAPPEPDDEGTRERGECKMLHAWTALLGANAMTSPYVRVGGPLWLELWQKETRYTEPNTRQMNIRKQCLGWAELGPRQTGSAGPWITQKKVC